MGVIIGSLMDDSALCVESPDSPSMEIGESTIMEVKDIGGRSPEVVYGMVGPGREIRLDRTFTLRKKDIPTVTHWLTSLAGANVTYNAGIDGEKKISGTFRLDGMIKFSSISPTLEEVTATYIGQILDANFAMPTGVEYLDTSSTESNITIDNAAHMSFTSPDKGDESGISIRIGRALFWSELPLPEKNSLPMTLSGDIEPDADAPLARNQIESCYREINLCINGYVARTWYVPSMMRYRIRDYIPKTIWYGQTEEEYQSNGRPAFTELLDLSDAENTRLSGGVIANRQDMPKNKSQMIPLPEGSVFQWFGYSVITNPDPITGEQRSWSPTEMRYVPWNELQYGKNPIPWSRIWKVGRTWVRRIGSEFKFAPYYTDAQITVTIGWSRTDDGVYLTAIGADGIEKTLLEFNT